MGNWLGCEKQKKTDEQNDKLNDQDKAILQCKKCRDNIKAYIKRLENNATKQRNNAKDHLKNKNRERAKMCLNQSKFYQAQIESSSNQLSAIEEQLMLIETTRNQKDVFQALEQGNKVLKELQKEVNIEKWEKISEDMDDLRDNQKEIADFLKSKNINEEEYENSLNKDLENLMKLEGMIVDSSSIPDAKTDKIKEEKVETKTKVKYEKMQELN